MNRFEFRMIDRDGVIQRFSADSIHVVRSARKMAFETYPLQIVSPILDNQTGQLVA